MQDNVKILVLIIAVKISYNNLDITTLDKFFIPVLKIHSHLIIKQDFYQNKSCFIENKEFKSLDAF